MSERASLSSCWPSSLTSTWSIFVLEGCWKLCGHCWETLCDAFLKCLWCSFLPQHGCSRWLHLLFWILGCGIDAGKSDFQQRLFCFSTLLFASECGWRASLPLKVTFFSPLYWNETKLRKEDSRLLCLAGFPRCSTQVECNWEPQLGQGRYSPEFWGITFCFETCLVLEAEVLFGCCLSFLQCWSGFGDGFPLSAAAWHAKLSFPCWVPEGLRFCKRLHCANQQKLMKSSWICSQVVVVFNRESVTYVYDSLKDSAFSLNYS